MKKTCQNCENLKKHFDEYCRNTSIHGIKYFAEKRTIHEKICWFFTISISLVFLAFMVYNIACKFINMPVIVSFSTKETPIYDIPFPTVTICSKAKLSKKSFDYSNLMHKISRNETLTPQEKLENNYAVLVCEDEINKKSLRNKSYDTLVNNGVHDFLYKNRRNFLHYCYWMGVSVPCEEIFTPTFSEEGVCYAFNMLDKKDMFKDDVFVHDKFFNAENASWNIEKGYNNKKNIAGYPYRAILSGFTKSLNVILYSKRHDTDEFCAGDDAGGYEVSLDIPGTLPRIMESFFSVSTNSNVIGTIIPEVFSTSENVKAYPPEKRDCYFQGEKPLRFFKVYTQSNCFLECSANFSLTYCDCVAFYMPRTNDTAICGIGSNRCLEIAEEQYLLNDVWVKSGNEENELFCNCMPICNDISYNLQISQNPIINKNIVKRKSEELNESNEYSSEWNIPYLYIDDEEIVDFASLILFMKRNHIETKQRNEIYGYIDLISGFGGLLGLFTGFSLLSLMEILYFCTLRIFGNYRMYGNWHGEDPS